MEKGTIIIMIQRDAKNLPFAKVLYNGQDAFNLDDNMKIFARYLTIKSSTCSPKDEGVVFVSTETGEVLETNKIDKIFDLYCISGSESGRKHVENLISTIRTGSLNKSIQVPVLVTDGKIPPIFINQEFIDESYKQQDRGIIDKKEIEKYELLNLLLTESSNSRGKTK